MVVVPTRELAMQTEEVCAAAGKACGIASVRRGPPERRRTGPELGGWLRTVLGEMEASPGGKVECCARPDWFSAVKPNMCFWIPKTILLI